MLKNINKNSGFSLIELLIVAGLASFVTLNLVSSVIRSRLNISEVSRIVVGDIRQAQANSLASKQYNNQHRCGYGIFLDLNSQNGFINNQYITYVGRVPGASGCPGSWRFGSSQDTPIILTRTLDSRLEFFDSNGNTRPNTYDITFEPYSAAIRIDNSHNPSNQQQNLSQIGIRKKGATCPSSDCIYVCVYSFGRIQTRTQPCALCDDPFNCPE